MKASLRSPIIFHNANFNVQNSHLQRQVQKRRGIKFVYGYTLMDLVPNKFLLPPMIQPSRDYPRFYQENMDSMHN